MDALPVGEQDLLLETIIKGTAISNPKELAHHILQQVLSWTGREPEDDMTVLGSRDMESVTGKSEKLNSRDLQLKSISV